MGSDLRWGRRGLGVLLEGRGRRGDLRIRVTWTPLSLLNAPVSIMDVPSDLTRPQNLHHYPQKYTPNVPRLPALPRTTQVTPPNPILRDADFLPISASLCRPIGKYTRLCTQNPRDVETLNLLKYRHFSVHTPISRRFSECGVRA
jgi:hypothetical protein